MEPTVPLDTIYTADEAAARLRLTNRGVIKLAKAHGLCSRSGRNYLFSESDLLALWEVLREPPKVSKLPTVKTHISDLRLYQTLQKLTANKKGRGRARWEATNAKNKEMREATKAAIEKWKDDEPLDHSKRDQDYWTPERKERRRLESLAKKKGWVART
ncbi:helix-turn-helix domain-containing protein [Ensifer sp.]|jgi:excisionase family DNA binding protein|uniref:helix-turn-helix domain-containing protein n=1 Tax=Ensifer sp. TaxID=1872086 RepID=UPI002E12E34E|nr:helix-turn-helix domain-containing protein [Ensifer sp.]